MNVWHLAADTPRRPWRITPGRLLSLAIGTWPIEAGQDVVVEFTVTAREGQMADGRTRASWVANRGANSYWTAVLGPFRDGEHVRYRVRATVRDEVVETECFSFTVGPAIHLALVWHHHQPLYRDLNPDSEGVYRFPWVRLHALRDYYGMAALVAQHPEVHLTINLSAVLLEQLEEYAEERARDRALVLTRTPTERLTAKERRELIETFFDAHWHHQIYPHPRYRELFEQRVQGQRFSDADLTDLKMWFNLAWFAREFRTGAVALPDGTNCSVQRFIEQERDFSQPDIDAMIEEQWRVIRNVVPLHRELQVRGQIEVSVTPLDHPILPLLVDTDRATVDRPGATLPPRFTHPEDAEAHVARAVEIYRERFGREPRGMWPAEGAVAECVVPLFLRHGIRWIATDEGVLARSGRHGYRVEDPNVLCQPYHVPDISGQGGLSIVFRHHGLSDAIAFRYQHVSDPEGAARAFVTNVKELADGLEEGHDGLLAVVLDGENAWGGYPDDGRPFLDAVYGALAADAELKTVTMTEYLDGNPERRVAAHPIAEQQRVYELFTGSWIDEAGSAGGADLGTWIGELEENRAWTLLGAVRDRLEQDGATPASHPQAFRALYAAEGSDWFWWFGEDQESASDEAFDAMFRGHLRAACRLAGVDAPPELDRDIVPHRVIWSFTAPVRQIHAGDELVVRTNCPGEIQWSTDGWRTVARAALAPSGGVMAGPSRHAVSVGRFSAGTLAFRFRCAHAGCAGAGPLCRGQEFTVEVSQTA
jgi:alpha-amylase/alpha-mannosidase (GH57 family)